MKSITTVAVTIACALALTACGGGGGNDSGSAVIQQADEGIWSDLNSGAGTFYYGMQSVILDDGSYWSVYGPVQTNGTFVPYGILQGTASSSGSNISGTYTDLGTSFVNGSYSGTVSAQNDLNLTFNEPSNKVFSMVGSNFNMSYDSIYNQPASLAAVAGSHPAINYFATVNPPISAGAGDDSNSNSYYPDNITISGSSLTAYENGSVIMTGTIAPHSTEVGVFDVSLKTTTANVTSGFSGNVPTGTVFNGILFQTSSGVLANDIEIIAAAGNNSGFFYLGQK